MLNASAVIVGPHTKIPASLDQHIAHKPIHERLSCVRFLATNLSLQSLAGYSHIDLPFNEAWILLPNTPARAGIQEAS
jgi:hypothetical protein